MVVLFRKFRAVVLLVAVVLCVCAGAWWFCERGRGAGGVSLAGRAGAVTPPGGHGAGGGQQPSGGHGAGSGQQPGGVIHTREGGVMRLPEGMSEKQWAKHAQLALEAVKQFTPVALSMTGEYADPYAGYRLACEKGLATRKLVDERTRGGVSKADQRDWEDFAKIGVRVDARLDEYSVMLDEDEDLSSSRVVLYGMVDLPMSDPAGVLRDDEAWYRFTVVKDAGGGYRVDGLSEQSPFQPAGG